MTSFGKDFRDFGPLGSSGVDTGWVVGAGVQEDDGLTRGGTEEGEVSA